MLHFDYSIWVHGWANVMIADSAARHTNCVTYVAPNDPLQETLEACILLLDGADKYAVSYFDEPGEHRFRFVRSGSSIRASVVWFPAGLGWMPPKETWVRGNEGWEDISDESPWPKSATVFDGTIPLPLLCRDVLAAASRILDTHGIDGYAQIWNGEFPTDEFGRLSEIIYQ